MRILVVEDDATLSTFYAQVFLRNSGSTPDLAHNATEALGYALTGDYDLITLDICMPDVDGLTIAPMLRNMNPHAVIAVISGNIDFASEDLSGTIDLALPKPVGLGTLDDLTKRVEKIQALLSEIRSMGVPLAQMTVAPELVG